MQLLEFNCYGFEHEALYPEALPQPGSETLILDTSDYAACCGAALIAGAAARRRCARQTPGATAAAAREPCTPPAATRRTASPTSRGAGARADRHLRHDRSEDRRRTHPGAGRRPRPAEPRRESRAGSSIRRTARSRTCRGRRRISRRSQQHADNPTQPEHIDPQARCLPGGVPRDVFHSETRSVQPPGYVVFLSAQNHVSRIIPLDGRPPLATTSSCGWAIRADAGRGTRWSSRSATRTSRGASTWSATSPPTACASSSAGRSSMPTRIDYRATHRRSDGLHAAVDDRRPVVRERPSSEPYGDEFWEDACHEGERSAEHMVLSPRRRGPSAQ